MIGIDFNEWKNNIAFIEKTLNEEGGQIAITEDLKWEGVPLKINSVDKKSISFVYGDQNEKKLGLKFIHADIISIIVNSIKNNKYL